MPRTYRIGILSDIHYAGAAERARGNDFELAGLTNPLTRLALKLHRRFIWLRNPLDHNHLLDECLEQIGPVDCLVANGDYSCDSAFVGVSDSAVASSVSECLDKLREKSACGANLRATIGDHELGKFTLVGRRGGMRLASWRRATVELGLRAFWKTEFGNHILIGVTSSLIAFPAFELEALPGERSQWESLRAAHLEEIRRTFSALEPQQRVLLFCHDPTALPFLWREDSVRGRIAQLEGTVVGHLHTNLVLWKSRLLAGMPSIGFLGHGIKRMSTALHEARCWRPFKVRLCPALAGVELLKDGGYLTADLDEDARQPARFAFHPLPR